jgi:hypothetical protein
VTKRTAAWAALAMLLLSACRSATEPGSSPVVIPTLDEPCAVFSREEIEDVTGSAVTRVHHPISKVTVRRMKDTCAYEAGRPYGAIVVSIDRDGERAFHREVEDLTQDTHEVIEVVPGLGDEAYLTGRTGLMVLESGEVVAVGTQYYAPDGPAVLRQLAALALSRSP